MKVSELFETEKKNPTGWWTAHQHNGRWYADEGTFQSKADADETAEDSDDDSVQVIYGELIDGDERVLRKLRAPTNEAYTPPVKNPKLGFRNKGEKVATGKAGIPIGGTKEWMKSFGATAGHIEQALRHVRQSAAYKKVKDLGMSDVSTDRQRANGSITFVGPIRYASQDGSKMYQRRMKLTVQANGKIDETAPNDFHRAPMTSPKPRLVPGDPVSSISKTMEASLEKMASNLANRRAKEDKEVARAQKAAAAAKK